MQFDQLIISTFALYFDNLRVLLTITAVPVVPAVVAFRGIQTADLGIVVDVACEVLVFVVTMIVWAALTIAVSDICLGKRPSVRPTYWRLADRIGSFFGTYLLVTIVCIVGFVLLVIPALAAMVMLMFVPAVTVIERRSGWAALRRSAALGKGNYWRNAGIYLALLIIMVPLVIIVGAVLVAGFVVFAPYVNIGEDFALMLAAELLGWLVGSIAGVGTVLLYYDMRVRKENYDAAALATDLMR